MEDNSVDLITAFSVFTHTEAFHLQWFLGLRRILRPEGAFYLTLQTEHTLANLQPAGSLTRSLQTRPDFDLGDGLRQLHRNGRLIYRFNQGATYSAHISYQMDYFPDVIGRIFQVLRHDIQHPDYQDSAILASR